MTDGNSHTIRRVRGTNIVRMLGYGNFETTLKAASSFIYPSLPSALFHPLRLSSHGPRSLPQLTHEGGPTMFPPRDSQRLQRLPSRHR